jgi:hypothetical protein
MVAVGATDSEGACPKLEVEIRIRMAIQTGLTVFPPLLEGLCSQQPFPASNWPCSANHIASREDVANDLWSRSRNDPSTSERDWVARGG